MKDMNYLLIEAMDFKISGYSRISMSYYSKLAECIYNGLSNSSQVYIMSRILNQSSNFGFGEVISQNVENIVYQYSVSGNMGLCSEKNYLAVAETSPFVKKVYSRIYLDESYRELAFSMFILNMVSPLDYLKHETDINWVLGRFKLSTTGLGSEDGVYIKPSVHVAMLAYYLSNISFGEDYGINPYDLVYYMLKAGNTVSKVLFVNNLPFGSYDVFDFSDETIKKYGAEMLSILPLLIKAGNIKKENVERLLYESGGMNCLTDIEIDFYTLMDYWDNQVKVIEFENKYTTCF